MIRVSDEARELLGALWSPDGEVLSLILRSPETEGPEDSPSAMAVGKAQTRSSSTQAVRCCGSTARCAGEVSTAPPWSWSRGP